MSSNLTEDSFASICIRQLAGSAHESPTANAIATNAVAATVSITSLKTVGNRLANWKDRSGQSGQTLASLLPVTIPTTAPPLPTAELMSPSPAAAILTPLPTNGPTDSPATAAPAASAATAAVVSPPRPTKRTEELSLPVEPADSIDATKIRTIPELSTGVASSASEPVTVAPAAADPASQSAAVTDSQAAARIFTSADAAAASANSTNSVAETIALENPETPPISASSPQDTAPVAALSQLSSAVVDGPKVAMPAPVPPSPPEANPRTALSNTNVPPPAAPPVPAGIATTEAVVANQPVVASQPAVATSVQSPTPATPARPSGRVETKSNASSQTTLEGSGPFEKVVNAAQGALHSILRAFAGVEPSSIAMSPPAQPTATNAAAGVSPGAAKPSANNPAPDSAPVMKGNSSFAASNASSPSPSWDPASSRVSQSTPSESASGDAPTDSALHRDSSGTASVAPPPVPAASTIAAPTTAPPTTTPSPASVVAASSVQPQMSSVGAKPDNSAPTVTVTLPRASVPADEPAATAMANPVQLAQMVGKAAQSEMRVGLNTSAFGSVEVRTVVRANDVGVVIGSEKGDLRSALANELPAIANTLQQQNLRLNQVNFHQSFAFSNHLSSGNNGYSRSFSPRSFASPSTSPQSTSGETAGGEELETGNLPAVSVSPGRLSVLA
jgi:Flagellar hook-length control protein FliK